MTAAERELYDAIPALVAACYSRPDAANALGFINTIYRKRISSSLFAFKRTLSTLLGRIEDRRLPPELKEVAREDADELDKSEITAALADGLAPDDYDLLRQTLQRTRAIMGAEAKTPELFRQLIQLRRERHEKIILFTQYTDTLDKLHQRMMAGPLSSWDRETIYDNDNAYYDDSREIRIKRFANAPGPCVLIYTDAAAESLNLQFCSAIVNYDVPWNPMKLEQRIGRIDRIGQERAIVTAVNLFYEDTAEKDAYDIMEQRLIDITRNVGRYQPILSDAINAAIAKETSGEITCEQMRIDEFNNDIAAPPLSPANIDIERLSRPLFKPHLLPDGHAIAQAGSAH